MSADPARAIADAVLYEGYLLWPYRRSAMKNQRRWTFGGIHPPAWSARHPDDGAAMQTQCLLEGESGASVRAAVRFLQVVERRVARETASGPRWVQELRVQGELHQSWQEAREREVLVGPLPLAGRATSVELPFAFAAGAREEAILDGAGARAGRIARSWEALEGTVRLSAEPLAARLARVTVRIENTGAFGGDDREQMLRRSLCCAHTVLAADGACFYSMADPPPHLHAHASRCANIGTWPALLGEPGSRSRVLSSRIILEDHARVSPESPGDLFDGGEIDQLLTLNILALTDEEKEQMRASDPRAREILERTEALSRRQLALLGGALRGPDGGPA